MRCREAAAALREAATAVGDATKADAEREAAAAAAQGREGELEAAGEVTTGPAEPAEAALPKAPEAAREAEPHKEASAPDAAPAEEVSAPAEASEVAQESLAPEETPEEAATPEVPPASSGEGGAAADAPPQEHQQAPAPSALQVALAAASERRAGAIAALCAACTAEAPRGVRQACVVAFQQLVAAGHLGGEVSHESSIGAMVVEAICGCYDASDEQSELPLLQCILTCVTSTTLHVHGDWLLRCVRTCYYVHLNSKSESNQTTAKAALTQMLNVVFARMEADSNAVPLATVARAADLELPAETAPSVAEGVVSFLNGVAASFGDVLPTFHSLPSIEAEAGLEGVHAFPTLAEVATEAPPSRRASQAPATQAGGDEAREQGQAQATAGGEAGDGQQGDANKGDEQEAGGGAEGDSAAGGPVGQQEARPQLSLLVRDAYLVFRALCKLSMKTMPDKPDPASVRGKVLSLSLLQILLENGGPVFCGSERFVGAIRQYLCLSLLKNCSSSVLSVFQLTCSIFLSVVVRFRARLKAEVGEIFPIIMLRVLEGQTGAAPPSFPLQGTVLRGAGVLAREPQVLVDLFVNYDCAVEGSNLFERLVSALIGLVQGAPPGAPSTTGLSTQQESALKASAATALRDVLSGLCGWLDAGGGSEAGEDGSVHGGTELADGEADAPATPAPAAGGSAEGGADEAGSAAHGGVGTPTPGGTPSIEQQKRDKLEFLEGVALFNKKPKKGIKFLIERGRVGETHEEIAAFLKAGVAMGLDKTSIGEYLGEAEESALKVMHAYVDALDFTGMVFDDGIRYFLQDFRLPGEAQKIDRLMEKFAERYCTQNPESSFTSADTAYVLAYSVIMLNTDAHNPQVKNKMSLEGFLKNNRGVGEPGELTEELLSAIYKRITTNEIKLKDGGVDSRTEDVAAGKAQGGGFGNLNDVITGIFGAKRRSVGGAGLDEDAIASTQERLRDAAAGGSGSAFVVSHDPSVARPMLEAVWPPLLAALSLGFEGAADGSAAGAQGYDPQLLLQCTRSAVRMAAVLGMETVRDAFITTLAKFTSLHEPSHMNAHNVNAIRTMLEIAEQDGNYLGGTWAQVLKCISRLAHLQMVAEGTMSDAALLGNAGQPQPEAPKPRWHQRRSGARAASLGHELAASEDPAVAARLRGVLTGLEADCLDRVFAGSARLDGDAVIDFVMALCAVSLEELSNLSRPRIFSLQKVVEISYFNMTRIRLVWSRIWGVLADYFVAVGCNDNLQVAMYAIDSLRQLSTKFLERDEMSKFNFQVVALRPFVVIMRRSKSPEIRELIIRCLSQMIQARVDNVSSGWKSMFMVFTTAATDDNRAIVKLAFETIEHIVREYFGYITETEATTFTDAVNCLIAFTNSPLTVEVSLNAIAFLRFAALKLAEGLPGGAQGGTAGAATGAAQGDAAKHVAQEHSHFWFPLLAGLGELVQDERPDVRRGAREVLFDTLRFHGHMFAPPFWERVFTNVLFPIFDCERGGGGARAAECVPLLVGLFGEFYDECAPALLGRVLELLVEFTARRPGCSKVGVEGLANLCGDCGAKFGEEEWLAAAGALADAWATSVGVGGSAEADPGVAVRLLQAAGRVYALCEGRPEPACEVLRKVLAAGVARGRAAGDLAVEIEASAALLGAVGDDAARAVPLCAEVMDRYLATGTSGASGAGVQQQPDGAAGAPNGGDAGGLGGGQLSGAQRMELMARAPLVARALRSMGSLPDLRAHLPRVFDRCCALVRFEHADAEVRAALAEFFASVGDAVHITQAGKTANGVS